MSLILLFLLFSACQPSSSNINYGHSDLHEDERQVLLDDLSDLHSRYDYSTNMLTKELTRWNYHTDAELGTFHEVRGSFRYAVMLADSDVDSLVERAWKVIAATIKLQDQDTTSKSCGVWPYYLEEPLATKKAPIDYNWADFNAVSLLTLWMGHQDIIPTQLKEEIRHALILAARSIQKRDVKPGYTNIAIMGTYVTYLVGHLFDLSDMQQYAQDRLQAFYTYTLDKVGFREYNSPTYNMVALEELMRMKNHIAESEARQMIDSLYSIGWNMIARHFHKPTMQWAGPHSRSYSSFVRPRFYRLLNEATKGQMEIANAEERYDGIIKHVIPTHLMGYFLNPQYPRTEIDIFEKEAPQIIGTCHLTNDYALASVNRSSMWNQRRPFLVHWGDEQHPKYLQLRFLHDGYDFSSATLHSQQKENRSLIGINLVLNGGDKHISIDRLKGGRFLAKDLRLRFEFGGVDKEELQVPDSEKIYQSKQISFGVHQFQSRFDKDFGIWEIGGVGDTSWVDYIIYSGAEHLIDLKQMEEAALFFGFSLSNLPSEANHPIEVRENGDRLDLSWMGLKLELYERPYPNPKNL
ncbi:MAG: hypothetical protein HKN87_20320 [Saprospiraceae bacterium]|nr:hypothetical protein [Saprospiraceae bacterium]